MPQNSSDLDERVYRKPRPDLYTALLVVALVALLVGTLMLYLHMQRYNFQIDRIPSAAFLDALRGGSPGLALADALRLFLT